jgi:hypothetical protein
MSTLLHFFNQAYTKFKYRGQVSGASSLVSAQSLFFKSWV